jgi:hypothetical protein
VPAKARIDAARGEVVNVHQNREILYGGEDESGFPGVQK